jgi:hypothetical protein
MLKKCDGRKSQEHPTEIGATLSFFLSFSVFVSLEKRDKTLIKGHENEQIFCNGVWGVRPGATLPN